MALPYLQETPSQTSGPFVHIGCNPRQTGFEPFAWAVTNVIDAEAGAERITVEGLVLDGSGSPTRDVLVELWQADLLGRYPQAGDAFRGFARSGTDFGTGLYRFETVKPGAAGGAPHLNLWIVARGINIGLFTRMYFPEQETANAADPVLALVDPPERRATLIARLEEREGRPLYRFDIRLQGEGETVFFDV